jgi:glycosyltransferase involved in cell wall biosynthesis
MRVAMIAYTPYEMDARVKRAAEALAERGHRVDVFAISQEGVRPARDTRLLRFYRLRMRKQRTAATRYAFEYGGFAAWAFVLVSLFQLRRRYQVVYVHNMPNFLVFAALIPKLAGARIILDVHDPAAELLACVLEREPPQWLRRLAAAEERISISFADALITVNEPMGQRLTAISRKPVTVVMNLPDPAAFSPDQRSPQRDGLQWLVYSGTISHRNGLDLMVRALSLLADDFPQLRFRIIGAGPAVEPVLRLAAEMGVADRVDFRGLVPYYDVPAAISDAAAGISAQREDAFGALVFSVKVAEYVGLGLPVLCSGTATMRHYFDGDELLFFEPGNTQDLVRAIRELLTDPATAAERARKSELKLDKLRWSAQKQALVETVEKLAGSAPNRRTG